ncbi:MAG TPA: DNA mismatch repair endonuclease MutL [bacterium]|nr:DNA mismatch repair endonuclease MutL [bacterium]
MTQDPIQILPPSAAERIAAGEVVERPASVVKELIENGLDAEAHRITVEIAGAGGRLIRVSDDGAGIPQAELRVAFRRFATSKIRGAEDLQRLRTYGFRGEALPSIAAVARVQMVTRPAGQEAARIVVAGGAEEAVGPASGPPGTTVTVEDLFFNTPARRQFLKSPARETAVIVETVEALALAAPEVGFRLVDEGREVFWYPPEGFFERARRVLGPQVGDGAIELAGGGGIAALAGVLGTPQAAQRRRTHQWFLVNGRPVRSPLLAHALAQAYHTLIPDDRHPAVVLGLRLPPAEVDANVHPRKTEVRFVRERQVFDEVVREVRRALHRVPLLHVVPSDAAGMVHEDPAPVGGSLPDPGVSPIAPAAGDALWAGGAPLTDRRWPAIRVIGQLALTYILGQSGGDLILIDQHAAHERVLYEQLIARKISEGGRAQGLAVPEVVELTPREAALLPELAPALEQLGFGSEDFGRDTVRLTAVPAIATTRAPGAVFRACLKDLADDHGAHAGRSLEERLAIATACHTAVRAGDPLDAAAMADLLAALARADDPFSCFHGRPTLVRVRGAEIEKWFYRRM